MRKDEEIAREVAEHRTYDLPPADHARAVDLGFAYHPPLARAWLADRTRSGPAPATAPGVKHDDTKPRWTLLPLDALADVVAVLEYGAAKYSPDNWRNVRPRWRYVDAAIRHVMARARGEILDPETGLPHTAHAVCCLLFIGSFDRETAVPQTYGTDTEND